MRQYFDTKFSSATLMMTVGMHHIYKVEMSTSNCEWIYNIEQLIYFVSEHPNYTFTILGIFDKFILTSSGFSSYDDFLLEKIYINTEQFNIQHRLELT